MVPGWANDERLSRRRFDIVWHWSLEASLSLQISFDNIMAFNYFLPKGRRHPLLAVSPLPSCEI